MELAQPFKYFSTLHNMNTKPAKFLFGIIGSPLGHTASPLLHTWAFAKMNLAAAYYSWPLQPEHLPSFVQAIRLLPIHGVSVTIPFKQVIIPYLDGLDNLATKIGAVNTLYWDAGKLKGTNTDVLGFIYPLRKLKVKPKIALVLGAGGAARGVLAGLRLISQETQIFIANRSFNKAQILAEEFNAQALPWPASLAIKQGLKPDLVINTSPMGMQGSESQAESPLSLKDFKDLHVGEQSSRHYGEGISSLPLAYDLVYRPLHTPFLQFAKQAGWQTQDGLDMLLGQGLEQLNIWTGQPSGQANTQTMNQITGQAPNQTPSQTPNQTPNQAPEHPKLSLPSVCQARRESGILKFIST